MVANHIFSDSNITEQKLGKIDTTQLFVFGFITTQVMAAVPVGLNLSPQLASRTFLSLLVG